MKKIFNIIFTAVFLVIPTYSMAAYQAGPDTIQNPIKYSTFPEFVAAVTAAAVNVLMPFVVLAFIWSGFLFVKAQGNEKELETAKTAIWWSVIGAFILMGAWGFAQIIGSTVSTITNVTP
ncbi:MAG TPA: hypothetical protein DCZ83_00680 [Candidatus Yonathbacteria bacterium]|nr:MAG: hypothetical protein EPN27_02530 [Patescibacteria group bacterium]HBB43898.1 hypothetical protein [Candidatus Yonathbacteria bacterium]